MSNSTPDGEAVKLKVESFLREMGFDPTPAQVERMAEGIAEGLRRGASDADRDGE